MRATRRLDQLREAQKETVGLNRGSLGPGRGKAGLPPNPAFDTRPTLTSQGIDKNLAHQARTLGKLTDIQFEEKVEHARQAVSRAAATALTDKAERRAVCRLVIKSNLVDCTRAGRLAWRP
jgi:hypothetical protein